MITYKLTVEQYMMKLYKCFFCCCFFFCHFGVNTDNLEAAVRVYFEQDVSDPRSCVLCSVNIRGWSETGNLMRIEKGGLILSLLPLAPKAAPERSNYIFYILPLFLNIKIFNVGMTDQWKSICQRQRYL